MVNGPTPIGRSGASEGLWLDRLTGALWAGLLLTIPFTSHPWVAAAAGWSPVTPLSALFLLGLVLLWLPTHLQSLRVLPVAALPLLAFAAAAVLSSAIASTLPLYAAFGTTPLSRELRALLTLAVGIGFYLVATLMPQSIRSMKLSLRWIYLGGFLLLAYATFQITQLPKADDPIPQRIIDFHRLFTTRDPFRARVTGFAYEPSWLGNQLVILYVPLWLASVVTGFSAFSARRRRLSLELGLLLWGLVVLFFSFARLAWLSALLMFGSLVAFGLWRAVGWLARGWGRRGGGKPLDARAGLLYFGAGLLALAIVAFLGVGLLLGGASLDHRLADLSAIDLGRIFSGRHPWPYLLANRLRYAERLMYWVSGFRVFSLYPVIGVGLGNAGFLMPSTVPAFGYFLPEIVRTLHQGAAGFPNPKSLWIRLLAETGVVGFALFVGWLALSAVDAARLARKGSGMARAMGLAALLALVAQITEGFSMDTFALPQLWIVLGLMKAAARLNRSEPSC